MPDANDGQAVPQVVRILEGVLSSIQAVVGEGAAQALLRYGAFEEGRRLATERDFTDIDEAARHVGHLLACEASARSDDDTVHVTVGGCAALAPRSSVLDTLLLGLFEGVIHGTLKRRLRGTIGTRDDAGAAEATFRPDDA